MLWSRSLPHTAVSPGPALPAAQPRLEHPCAQLVMAAQPLPRADKAGSLMATLHNSAPLLLSLFLPDTQLLLFIWITFLCYGIWVVFPSLLHPLLFPPWQDS
jgi:hypothetical protein